jgi:hypothetical protein
MAIAAPETKARSAASVTQPALESAWRTCLLLAALALVGWGLGQFPSAVHAGLPQPMCVYYGQARDGYGLPYRTNAEVILRRGTNEIARHTIRGALRPGVNFALNVHLDDGRTATSYSPKALHSGELVSIVVRDSGSERTIMENQAVPPVGQPGELILRNVTAAEDADGDALPDAWEWELIAWSEGWLHSLTEVRGGDDFDGDGMSNWMEYQAGTFPFLNNDYLAIEQSALTPNGRLRLTLLSVAGKAYSVQCATNLTAAVWTPCPFGLDDTGPLQLTPGEGTGNWFSLYLAIEEPARFFRLSVE